MDGQESSPYNHRKSSIAVGKATEISERVAGSLIYQNFSQAGNRHFYKFLGFEEMEKSSVDNHQGCTAFIHS